MFFLFYVLCVVVFVLCTCYGGHVNVSPLCVCVVGMSRACYHCACLFASYVFYCVNLLDKFVSWAHCVSYGL